MAYSSGILNKRIAIAKNLQSTDGEFGRGSGGIYYDIIRRTWASITFSKGTQSMRQGALDAYDILLIRMRWMKDIDRDCIIIYNHRFYAIQSLNENFYENIIQITAVEAPDKILLNPNQKQKS